MVGHETTAMTISHALLHLARDQMRQSKLRDEILAMNQDITYESINKLVYLDAVVREV